MLLAKLWLKVPMIVACPQIGQRNSNALQGQKGSRNSEYCEWPPARRAALRSTTEVSSAIFASPPPIK
jgi:hypothetical protein